MEGDQLSTKARTSGASSSALSSSIKLCNGIEVSVLDDRQYKLVVLSNHLHVLLISDPKTEKASAAMDVHVGHQSDPEDIAGLAHFCEHMLFLGTAKYPDENSYKEFLSAHNGCSNASTSQTHTNFYFDVASDFFYQALDRFASFFTAPLFTPSAVMREMQAVHSEHCKNLQNDQRRLYQLQKHLSHPQHAFHKFGSGNIETLLENPKLAFGSDFDVREPLIEFYRKYYSASMMKLVLYSYHSLIQLQTWAEMFSEIANTGVKPSMKFALASNGSLNSDIVPFDSTRFPREILVEPVREIRILDISWPLTSLYHKIRRRPSSILSHLLGHEGLNSILSLLKAKQWANGLSAGLSRDEEDWALFTVKIDATELGLQYYEQIVSLIYEYLAMVRASAPLPGWIFQEAQDLAVQHFRFKPKERPISYTSFLSNTMQRFPTNLIVSGCYFVREFDEKQEEAILAQLVPRRMRLTVVSKEFFARHAENQKIEQEPWYQTSYIERLPSDEQLAEWDRIYQNNEPFHETLEAGVRLSLPHQNVFICSDFDINVPAIVSDDAFRQSPALMCQSETYRLWYKPDQVFQKPNVQLFFQLYLPTLSSTPRHAALSGLLTRYIKDSLNEYAYNAELAGMHYSISSSIQAIEVRVSGFSQKAHLLLDKIMGQIAAMTQPAATFKYDIAMFERVKDCCSRSFRNFWSEEPYQHAVYAAHLLTEPMRWSLKSKLEALETITINDLEQHARSLLYRAPIFVEGYVFGNISPSKALMFLQELVIGNLRGDRLGTSELYPFSKASRPRMSAPPVIHFRPKDDFVWQQKDFNTGNVNSALCNLYQLPVIHDRELALWQSAKIQVLCHLLHEPCFNQLRTQEQLGYLVFSGRMRNENVEYFRVLIQSDKASPDYLDQRCESFLLQFRETVLEQQLTQRQVWQKHIAAVIHSLSERPKQEKEQAERDWQEISTQFYSFDRRQQLAGIVGNLNRHDLLRFFDQFIHPSGSERRKLSVRIYGKNHVVTGWNANLQPTILGTQVGTAVAICNAFYSRVNTNVIRIDDYMSFREEMPLSREVLPKGTSRLVPQATSTRIYGK
uniref:Insulindegradinglike enzyme putative n=1 Tax=Albugo laibachii Nc14 TaxID=890382 RepID=F0WEV2_9STRA|nr:insulindegradinglike enzyme putative [Albugo laibachii Nc14]|eukprot:CCA19734.1 insulindegradinglike enzyme putative [Albugo laibachii Nc14]